VRGLTLTLCLGAACIGSAQNHLLLPMGLSKALPKTGPSQTGPGTPAAQTGAAQPLPPPIRQRGEELRVIRAGSFEDSNGQILADGGVELAFRGYDIRAERVRGNKAAEVFTLEGKALITGQGTQVEGETIEVDFRRNVFRFVNAKAILSPEQVGGGVQSSVIVEGTGGIGTSKEVRASGGSLTTCDLDSPHFRLRASETLIVPEKYAKLRDVRLELFGAEILRLPLLIIPLTPDAQRYWPEVGQSPDEGYYIKSRFGTPLRGDDYLDHRLDLMEKKGVGFGVDWQYQKAQRLTGRLTSYFLRGPNPSVQLGLDHQQKLFGGDLSLSGQYMENDYTTAPSSALSSGRAQYVLPWGGGQSRFSYQRTENQSSGFSSLSEGWSFGDTRRFGQTFTTSLDLNLSSSLSRSQGFSSESERLDVRFTGTGAFRAFDADLQYQRAIPVKGDGRFLSAGDKTPLLTLKSTSSKLFGQKAARTFPVNMEGSVGELFEAGTSQGTTRITFGADTRQTIGQGPVTATMGGRFLQGLYSDDTAQYVVNYDSSLRWAFSKDSSFNVSYRNLRSFGFTPLSIDRTGRNDFFSADLSWKPSRSLLFAGSTGYDVLQSSRGFVPWQSVSLRAEWNPGEETRVRASSFYDTFSSVWSSFQLDADFKIQQARFILGARYDGRRQKLGAASLTATNLRWGKIGASMVVDYNGFSQQVEAIQAQFVYDLHCSEAVLEVVDNRVGFRSGRQIGFYIRLKAFPAFSPFGIGRRGQAIGGAGGIGFGGG
jgi:hypothetical protein